MSFTNTESNTVVECQYDSMGRRAYKKVTVDGNVTLHQRYIYRGYLQIACIDLTRTAHPALWYITWDPWQPVATRPLAIQINGTWHTYGWDLTKNICELYSTAGAISTSYTPFGKVTASGSVTQIIQWSSEVWGGEPGLVYYNWRYYDSVAGRWVCRDNNPNYHVYEFCNNMTALNIDLLGNNWFAVITLSLAIPIGVFFAYRAYRAKKNKGDGNAVLYSPNKIAYEGLDEWRDWQTGLILYDQHVYSSDELRSTLLAIQNKQERRCINNIRLAAHGSYAGHINEYNGIGTANMTLGKEELRESINEFEISNLFKDISFCRPCSIELRSCNIGKSPLLRARLKKYGCDVILYDDYVAP